MKIFIAVPTYENIQPATFKPIYVDPRVGCEHLFRNFKGVM